MTATVLSSTGLTAPLAQPRVLLAFIVLALASIDQTLVVTDWLANSRVAVPEAQPGNISSAGLPPWVAVPAWLVLREL